MKFKMNWQFLLHNLIAWTLYYSVATFLSGLVFQVTNSTLQKIFHSPDKTFQLELSSKLFNFIHVIKTNYIAADRQKYIWAIKFLFPVFSRLFQKIKIIFRTLWLSCIKLRFTETVWFSTSIQLVQCEFPSCAYTK